MCVNIDVTTATEFDSHVFFKMFQSCKISWLSALLYYTQFSIISLTL